MDTENLAGISLIFLILSFAWLVSNLGDYLPGGSATPDWGGPIALVLVGIGFAILANAFRKKEN